MKYIILISITFILSGCGKAEPVPCTPFKCSYPKLPTYKVPKSNKLTPTKDLGDGTCNIPISDLLELVRNNTKLRKICTNYAVINKRVNKEYE